MLRVAKEWQGGFLGSAGTAAKMATNVNFSKKEERSAWVESELVEGGLQISLSW